MKIRLRFHFAYGFRCKGFAQRLLIQDRIGFSYLTCQLLENCWQFCGTFEMQFCFLSSHTLIITPWIFHACRMWHVRKKYASAMRRRVVRCGAPNWAWRCIRKVANGKWKLKLRQSRCNLWCTQAKLCEVSPKRNKLWKLRVTSLACSLDSSKFKQPKHRSRYEINLTQNVLLQKEEQNNFAAILKNNERSGI